MFQEKNRFSWEFVHSFGYFCKFRHYYEDYAKIDCRSQIHSETQKIWKIIPQIFMNGDNKFVRYSWSWFWRKNVHLTYPTTSFLSQGQKMSMWHSIYEYIILNLFNWRLWLCICLNSPGLYPFFWIHFYYLRSEIDAEI